MKIFVNVEKYFCASNKTCGAKRKFCFVDPVEVPLPSKGKFYQDTNDEALKQGFISLLPMSVSEEETFTNPAYLKQGTAVRMVLDACMESDYEASRLLSFDATYLLYALRNISYGDDYTFKIQCPDCGKEYEHTVKISEVPFDELPEDAQEVYTIKLPLSKYTVRMNLSRLADDERAIRMKKNNPDVSETAIDFASHTLSITDTKGVELNPKDFIDFFAAIPALDRAEITETFKFTRNNPKVTVTCPKCGETVKPHRVCKACGTYKGKDVIKKETTK